MKAETETRPPPFPGLTLAGDLACFVVFGLLGLRSHEEGVTPANFGRALVPFAVAWLFMATIFGLLRPMPAPAPPRRLLAAWLPAWAAGLAARILIFGRALAPGFAIVSFIVPAFFLLAWRHASSYFHLKNPL